MLIALGQAAYIFAGVLAGILAVRDFVETTV
jgi:hypothetical protein